jgi:hypothetical protein
MARETLTAIAVALAATINLATPATAASPAELPMDRVYQGPIRLPDFAGRDQKYKMFPTRIREGMQSGPDFAGHYALVQIGCGTGCRFAYVGDVATGQVYNFPYGGEDYQEMNLDYSAKSNRIRVTWIAGDGDDARCKSHTLVWNGTSFVPPFSSGPGSTPYDLGPREVCETVLWHL